MSTESEQGGVLINYYCSYDKAHLIFYYVFKIIPWENEASPQIFHYTSATKFNSSSCAVDGEY
jgi:hypothetical protein